MPSSCISPWCWLRVEPSREGSMVCVCVCVGGGPWLPLTQASGSGAWKVRPCTHRAWVAPEWPGPLPCRLWAHCTTVTMEAGHCEVPPPPIFSKVRLVFLLLFIIILWNSYTSCLYGSSLYILAHLLLTWALWYRYYFCPWCYLWGNWDTERFSNLSKVTQLVNFGIGVWA